VTKFKGLCIYTVTECAWTNRSCEVITLYKVCIVFYVDAEEPEKSDEPEEDLKEPTEPSNPGSPIPPGGPIPDPPTMATLTPTSLLRNMPFLQRKAKER
jgi:hypothetical protein